MSLIKELYDNEYPFNGFNKIRETARAILLNEKNEIGLMLIQGEDYFGVRNHYESPGGGVELNEIRLDTVKREVLEEAGYVCDVEKFLGTTINRYNLIQTITISHYYICRIKEKKTPQRMDAEVLIMKDIEFKSLNDWLQILSDGKSKVDRLVNKREYEVIKFYQSLIQ